MKKKRQQFNPSDSLLFLEVVLATATEMVSDGENIMDDPFRLSILTVIAACRRLQLMSLDPRLSSARLKKQRAAKIKTISKAFKRTLLKLKETG